MAPRYTNSVSNSDHHAPMTAQLSPRNIDNDDDQHNEGGGAGEMSNNKICSVRDVNDNKIIHEGWIRRVLQRILSLNTSSSPQQSASYRKYYQGTAGMILTAVAYALCKRGGGRGKRWIILSFISFLNSAKKKNNNNNNNNNNEKKLQNVRQFPGYINLGVQFSNSLRSLLINFLRRPDYAYAEQASLSLLRTAAQHGVVKCALIGATEIIFSTHEGWKRTEFPSQILQTEMIDLLSRHGSDVSTLPKSFGSKAAPLILTALPFVYLAFAYRMFKGIKDGNLDDEDFFSSKLLTTPKGNTNAIGNKNIITFSDVAGLDNILPEVREIVSYLQSPSGYHSLGAMPPRGILLHGEPGTGKTLLAKAVAGEAECDAFCVCSGSDFCEMYVFLIEHFFFISYTCTTYVLQKISNQPSLSLFHSQFNRFLCNIESYHNTSTSTLINNNNNNNKQFIRYVGRGAARVRKLFKEARKVALKNYDRKQRLKQGRWLPSWGLTAKHVDTGKKEEKKDNSCLRPATAIIFIDELDALAKSRSYDGITSSNDERDQTLNQLLTEMDGFQTNKVSATVSNNSDNDVPVTVIVIAATNIPNVLDPAILRRFDRQIHVPFPDNRGRMEILKVHAAKTRCRFSTICWDYLAEQTPNFSGSDLKQVVNDAALLAVRGGSKHIEQGHLLQAIQRARTMKVRKNSIGRGMISSSSNNHNANQESKEPPLLHPFSWYSESEDHGRR